MWKGVSGCGVTTAPAILRVTTTEEKINGQNTIKTFLQVSGNTSPTEKGPFVDCKDKNKYSICIDCVYPTSLLPAHRVLTLAWIYTRVLVLTRYHKHNFRKQWSRSWKTTSTQPFVLYGVFAVTDSETVAVGIYSVLPSTFWVHVEHKLCVLSLYNLVKLNDPSVRIQNCKMYFVKF